MTAARVALILPALNEERTIGALVRAVPRDRVGEIIVVDNGSHDQTGVVARAEGATVVREERRGYGSACLAGIAAARRAGADIVAFMDADGSDPPERLPDVLDPVEHGEADLALGIRDPRLSERGALLWQQHLGNAVTLILMRWLTGACYRDLPPCKAMTTGALERILPDDVTYGFTLEMLLRAHDVGLKVVEVPLGCRKRRGGDSKVSGTVRGTVMAGAKMLSTLWRHVGKQA